MSIKYEDVEELFDNGELPMDYPPSAYWAYCTAKNISIGELKARGDRIESRLETYLVGFFESYKEFVMDYMETVLNFPKAWYSQIAVDYKRTWTECLQYRYTYVFMSSGDEERGEGWYIQDH